jgi:hypothetical protein
MEISDILRQFGTFCIHLVHFSGFGTMYQEKSGNPDFDFRRLGPRHSCAAPKFRLNFFLWLARQHFHHFERLPFDSFFSFEKKTEEKKISKLEFHSRQLDWFIHFEWINSIAWLCLRRRMSIQKLQCLKFPFFSGLKASPYIAQWIH